VEPLFARETINLNTGRHVSRVLDKRGRVYVCDHVGTHVGILQNQLCKQWWPKVVARSAVVASPMCGFGQMHRLIMWCIAHENALETSDILQTVTDQTPIQTDRVCYLYVRDMNRTGVLVCEKAECLNIRDVQGLGEILDNLGN